MEDSQIPVMREKWLIYTIQKSTFTPPKFNIAPEKWWLEDYFPREGNFPGAMLNFGRVVKTFSHRGT